MKIYNSLDEIDKIDETVVALGNFDGVHKGHQEIIMRTVASAKSAGLKSGVFTFSNHTSTVIPGARLVKNIQTNEEKAEIIRKLGVDYLFNVPFTKEILSMSPEDFVSSILVDKFNIREAYCGFNYSFGYKAQGTPEVLMHEGLKHGFGIHVQEPYKINDIVVSSTYIRSLIEEGRMEECSRFIGRNYTISGEVIRGNTVGRTIGFPTANIAIEEGMAAPPNGVYVTLCSVDGVKYPAVTNVGVKPTIGIYAKNIETNIFNFHEDIYGKNIAVEFVKFMRPEKKFDSLDELKAQIERDIIESKAYHRKAGEK